MADDTDNAASDEKTPKTRPRRTPRGRRPGRTASAEAAQADLPLDAPAARGDDRAPEAPPARAERPTSDAPRETRAEREPERAASESPVRESADERPSRDEREQGGRDEFRRPEESGEREDRPERGERGNHFGGSQGHGGGGGGHEFGFRKKFKRGKGKFFQPGLGGGGQGGGGPRWKQPGPMQEASPLGALPSVEKYADADALAARAAEVAGDGEPLHLDELAKATHAELMAGMRQREIPIVDNPGRMQMIASLIKWAAENRRPLIDRGHLDLAEEGHGFVVHVAANHRLLPESTFVPAAWVRRLGLRRGVALEVQAQAPAEGERCPVALVVRSVMDGAPEDAAKVVPFEELVPYYPTRRIHLEVPSTEAPSKIDVSMRCVDILTPIGFGQRGLIVAPPRTGKTILLQGLANSIAVNFPEVKLIVLLVDERPEEVTDFRRRVKGEVVSSTFDETPESHVHAAEMVGEKARRLVERGEHVVILLDSITRLARAYNALASNSGKIMSGGVEATALQRPKRFFGAARNIEDGGSLTIIGSALVDTNSRMDEVIFEEFKGTGNMELHLDRDLVNKRIFPSINFERSGTRKEELLYHPDELQKIYGLRRIMLGVPAYEAMEMLIQRLKKTRSNAEFLLSLAR